MATSSTALPSLSQVCQGPLSWRVESATRVINECSSKEAAGVLRTLISSVFGAVGPSEPGILGWGLQMFTKSQHPMEFRQLYGFLCSQGPLLGMVLRHAHDPFMVFEFPVSFLPVSAQAGIAEGTSGPLYAGKKMVVPGPGKLPHTILLNSLEYFMFHFCYYLVHIGTNDGGGGGSLVWTCVGDAVYPSLLEDYLNTFLPCDGSLPPALGLQQQHHPASVDTQHSTLVSRLAPSGLQQLSSLMMSPISAPHFLGGGSSPHQPPHTSSPLLRGTQQQQPRQAAWTSQTVAQILVEMWVNQCRPVSAGSSSAGRHLLHSPSSQHYSPPSSPLQQGHFSSPPQQQQGQYSSPSLAQQQSPPRHQHFASSHTTTAVSQQGIGPSIMSEHIRAVRMVIKHFHYFSNSVRPAQPSPLDNLRRSLWSMCRASFYQLFVQLLARWPLDSSFRLLLEAWLSYIQPWRYTSNRLADDNNVESAQPLTWQWQRFVADNLLFYSGILAAVLPRLLRLDLSAPRNAHMLYRITKVLYQPNLAALLQATEDALYGSQHGLLLPPPAPYELCQQQHGGEQQQLPAHVVQMAARAHMLEMEGSHYVYLPMFGQYSQELVQQVLVSVRAAELAVQSELEASSTPTISKTSGGGGGVLAAVKRQLLNWLEAATAATTADNNLEELQRSLAHLQAAAIHLHQLFQISENSVLSACGEGSPSKTRVTVPDQVNTANGPVLTDQGRRQLVSGLRRKDLKYEGDPDLRPIAYGEFAVLVRWLYALATFLNSKYYGRLCNGFYERGVVGLLWRCVLQPPLTVYEYHKPGWQQQHEEGEGGVANCSASYPSRVGRQLPPRLSFRKAANRQAVVSVVAVFLLLHVLAGVPLCSLLLYILLPATLLYLAAQPLLCRHVLRPPPSPRAAQLLNDHSHHE